MQKIKKTKKILEFDCYRCGSIFDCDEYYTKTFLGFLYLNPFTICPVCGKEIEFTPYQFRKY